MQTIRCGECLSAFRHSRRHSK